MEASDLTVEILKDIRTEIRSTNARLEETRQELSQRIDATNATLAETRTELSQRIAMLTEGQVRVATEVVGVASAVRELSGQLREDRVLRDRFDDHDKRIAALELRVG